MVSIIVNFCLNFREDELPVNVRTHKYTRTHTDINAQILIDYQEEKLRSIAMKILVKTTVVFVCW